MTYTKPEVDVLGNAAALIELMGSKSDITLESDHTSPNPAYDLDE